MDKIQQDFEAWMSGNGAYPKAVEKTPNGDYRLMQAACAWPVWQAAVKSVTNEKEI